MHKHILTCITMLSVGTPIVVCSASISEHDKKLLVAAQMDWKMQAKKALENGAGINKRDHERCFVAPLMIAVDSLHVRMVDYLMRKGAAINTTDFFGNTVLHLLAEKDFHEYPKKNILQIAKKLLQAGADLNVKNYSGVTALAVAKLNRERFYYDNTMLIGVLSCASKKQRGKKKRELNERLHRAALLGERKQAQELLLAKADVNSVVSVLGYTPLLVATGRAQPEIVLDLLQAQADVNARDHLGRTAIHMIVDKPSTLYPKEPNFRILKALVEAHADLTLENANGWTPLELAQVNLQCNGYDDRDIVNILQIASGDQKRRSE